MLSTMTRKTQYFTAISPEEKAQGFLSVPTSPLLKYSPTHAFTLAQAFEGVQVFGATGSGKTSATLSHIARALLHGGFGGLVLCAKEDEADNWRDYAEQTGRSDSLVVFDKDHNEFNFMAYELARSGSPFDVIDAIDDARNALKPEGTSHGEGQVWQDAAKDLLVASLLILYGSTGSCKLGELKRLIGTAPPDPKALSDAEWRKQSAFAQHVEKARAQGIVNPQALSNAIDYFIYQYAPLDPRPRSSVMMNLMTTLNRFDYGILFDKFMNGTTIVPELTHGGLVIVVDLPAMHSPENRIAGHIWKRAFQKATTRQADTTTRPVFLFADEAQYFYSHHDAVFQSTARSSRVSTIYATQNLDAYRTELGGGEKASTATRAFLANLRTQVFHSNGSDETNIYASTLIGKTLQWRRNRGSNKSQSSGTSESWSSGVSSSVSESQSRGRSGSSNIQGYTSGSNSGMTKGTSSGTTSSRGRGTSSTFGEGISEGASEQKDFRLDPDVFLTGLRTGSPTNDFKVDAVLVSPEIPEPYLPVTFDQRTN